MVLEMVRECLSSPFTKSFFNSCLLVPCKLLDERDRNLVDKQIFSAIWSTSFLSSSLISKYTLSLYVPLFVISPALFNALIAISTLAVHINEKLMPLALQTSTVVLKISWCLVSDIPSDWVVFASLSRDSHPPNGGYSCDW